MKQPMNPSMPRHPRNPLVAPTLLRKAGAHRRSAGGERQRSARTLRREIAHLLAPPRLPPNR